MIRVKSAPLYPGVPRAKAVAEQLRRFINPLGDAGEHACQPSARSRGGFAHLFRIGRQECVNSLRGGHTRTSRCMCVDVSTAASARVQLRTVLRKRRRPRRRIAGIGPRKQGAKDVCRTLVTDQPVRSLISTAIAASPRPVGACQWHIDSDAAIQQPTFHSIEMRDTATRHVQTGIPFRRARAAPSAETRTETRRNCRNTPLTSGVPS